MKHDPKQSHSCKYLLTFCSQWRTHSVINWWLKLFKGFKCKQILGTYLAAVYWTHFNKVFLAFPWILVATFRLLGGLAVSELTVLSTEDALLDKGCSWGKLLVSSSICGSTVSTKVRIIFVLLSDVPLFQLKMVYLTDKMSALKGQDLVLTLLCTPCCI